MGKEKNDSNKWKKLFVILVFILGISILANISQSNQINYYQENYEYSCSDGKTKQCVSEDEDFITCDTDRFEQAVCVSEDWQRWTNCQEGQNAVCVDEDSTYGECESDEWSICVDSDHDWITCDIGEKAKCIDKNIAGTISSSGIYSTCDIGESSTCIDWDTEGVFDY